MCNMPRNAACRDWRFCLWFIVMTLMDCARAIRKLNGERSQQLFILHGVIAVIFGILVGGIFEYNLGDSEVLMMFVCVVASRVREQ